MFEGEIGIRILSSTALQIFRNLMLNLENILKSMVEADGCLLISQLQKDLYKNI